MRGMSEGVAGRKSIEFRLAEVKAGFLQGADFEGLPTPYSWRKLVILIGLLEICAAKFVIRKGLGCRVVTTKELGLKSSGRG
jgi:hypothetical protein